MRRHCVNGFDCRNLSKRNVVRATPALVELNSDWLNRLTRTRVSDDSRRIVFTKIDKMDSKICFEMSFIVVEAIR